VKTFLFVVVAALVVSAPVLVLAFAPAPDAGSRSVEYKTYNGYAESRNSGLKGDASYLAITSRTEFVRLLDPVLTPRGAPDAVAKDAFDTQLFVAVIKRSDVLWDYKVEKVTANGDTLTVHYRATPRQGGAPVLRGETRKAEPVGTVRGGATVKVEARPKATEKEAPTTRKAEAPARATEKAVAATEIGQPTSRKGATPRPPPTGTGKYLTTERVERSSASFDSPLILSVPKDKYLTIVFIENGKKVGTARVGD
jgi:hypothetical protein